MNPRLFSLWIFTCFIMFELFRINVYLNISRISQVLTKTRGSSKMSLIEYLVTFLMYRGGLLVCFKVNGFEKMLLE